MKSEITLRVDLNIPAQQIISQLKLWNEDIEKQVEEGVNLAVKEIGEMENLPRLVADQVKKQFLDHINGHLITFETRRAIQESLGNIVTAKIQQYSEEVGERILAELSKK